MKEITIRGNGLCFLLAYGVLVEARGEAPAEVDAETDYRRTCRLIAL